MPQWSGRMCDVCWPVLFWCISKSFIMNFLLAEIHIWGRRWYNISFQNVSCRFWICFMRCCVGFVVLDCVGFLLPWNRICIIPKLFFYFLLIGVAMFLRGFRGDFVLVSKKDFYCLWIHWKSFCIGFILDL